MPYDDRTHGDLLEEFYLVVAAEIDDLGSHRADLSAEDTARLARLETLLNPKDGEVESGTGDPLADYWEYRLAKDLPVNLDLNEAPPRELWDHPGEAA